MNAEADGIFGEALKRSISSFEILPLSMPIIPVSIFSIGNFLFLVKSCYDSKQYSFELHAIFLIFDSKIFFMCSGFISDLPAIKFFNYKGRSRYFLINSESGRLFLPLCQSLFHFFQKYSYTISSIGILILLL